MPGVRKSSNKTVSETLGVIRKDFLLGNHCWCNFTYLKLSRVLDRDGWGSVQLNLNMGKTA